MSKRSSHPNRASKGRHGSGGPLKRTGPKADDWDMLVGPSLDSVPATQLPKVKTVLQRYRALRIQYPYEPKASVAKQIAEEVKLIWARARVPTVTAHNCALRVLDKIEYWNSHHNPGEHAEEITARLDTLLDLAPKLRGKVSEEIQLNHLKEIMRQESEVARRKSEGDQYDWEVDFQFYLDQYKVAIVQEILKPSCIVEYLHAYLY